MGCFNIGLLFEEGHGVSKDEARAATLYATACEGGHAVGCSNLGGPGGVGGYSAWAIPAGAPHN